MQLHGDTPANQQHRQGAVGSVAPARMLPEVHPAHQAVADLARSLAGQRPIAFNINLARIAGDVKAGLFMSQLLYWTRVGVDVDKNHGWIFKTREQWCLETGLSRAEQETARARLVKLRLVHEHLHGSPARLCFRIDPQALGMALSALLRSEPVQWTLFDLRSNEQNIKVLLGRNMAFYRVLVEALGSVSVAIFATKALAVQKSVNEAQLERAAKALKKGNPTTQTPSSSSWEQNWFSLKASQWEIETGLRVGQIRKAKQDLCQINLLEEATQTYPKKRLFARLNISALSHKLAQLSVAKLVSHVKNTGASTRPAGGLLNELARRVGVAVDSSARTFCPTGSLGTSGTKCPSTIPGTVFGQSVRGEVGDIRTICPSDIEGSTRTKCPTASRGSSGTFCPSESSQPSQGTIPSRFPLSSNPVGEFQRTSRRVPAPQLAGLNRTIGEFEQRSRRVSAPLHAGAWVLTTYKTTTTTTEQPAPIRQRRALTVIPGKVGQRSVVVVKSSFKLPKVRGQVAVQNQAQSQEYRGQPVPVPEVQEQAPCPVESNFELPLAINPKIVWPMDFTHADKLKAIQHLQFSPHDQQQFIVDGIRTEEARHCAASENTSLEWFSWPIGFTEDDQKAALRLLSRVDESARQQDLIDELAGNMLVNGRVKRPLSYLRNLIDRDLQTPGGLLLEVAPDVQERRRVAKLVEQAANVDKHAKPTPSVDAKVTPMPDEIKAKLAALRQQWALQPRASQRKAI